MKSRKKTAGYVNRLGARRRIGRAIITLFEISICVGVVGTFSYHFLEYAEGSTDFQVHRVEIHGLSYLNEHEVLRMSGITNAENILFFGSKEVERRVEELPYVRACHVGLLFPDTVILQIDERVPEATLMVNSHSYEIDAEGVVLRRYEPTEMPVTPFLTTTAGAEFVEAGERIELEALQEAIRLWRLFSDSPMSERLTVSELAVNHMDDIRMYCDELPFELRWGRGNFEDQVRRLTILWEELGGLIACQEYLDLRFDADLVCK